MKKFFAVLILIPTFSAFAQRGETFSPILCSKLSGPKDIEGLQVFFSPNTETFSFTVPGPMGTLKRFSFDRMKHELVVVTQDSRRTIQKGSPAKMNCSTNIVNCMNAVEMFLAQLRRAAFASLTSPKTLFKDRTRVWDAAYCSAEFLLDYQGRLTAILNQDQPKRIGAR